MFDNKLVCEVTQNICGTDTHAEGKECNCIPCYAYSRIKHLSETLQKALERNHKNSVDKEEQTKTQNLQLNAMLSEIANAQLNSCADLRAKGWAVAVHNDYKLSGDKFTFWLFTKNNVCVKGEGKTDRAALDECREKIARLEKLSENEALEEA